MSVVEAPSRHAAVLGDAAEATEQVECWRRAGAAWCRCCRVWLVGEGRDSVVSTMEMEIVTLDFHVHVSQRIVGSSNCQTVPAHNIRPHRPAA